MANKNVMFQLGWTEFSDDEYRKEFDIPEGVDINNYMFKKSEEDNVNYYMTELGMKESEARSRAKKRTSDAKQQLKSKGVKF